MARDLRFSTVMNLPKNILVPTDFSACADEALDAIALAEKLGATVTLMHAYEIPVIGFPDGAFITGADIAGRILTASQTALDALVAKRKDQGTMLKALLRGTDRQHGARGGTNHVLGNATEQGT